MKCHTVCNVKEANLEELLQNPTFVDYFNVFLSLPIFPQRFVYKFKQKDFELDPPMKKSKYILDKKQLIRWLSVERLILFRTTPLFHELVLCMELLNTDLYMVNSSHRFDYEDYRHVEDEEFLQECCGNVIGMRHFGHYLAGGAGEHLLRFWLDAEHFQTLPDKDLPTKWNAYREVQLKYFKGKAHGAFDLLSAENDIMYHDVWTQSQTFGDTSKINPSKPYTQTTHGDFQNIMKSTDYRQVQNIILAVLKQYWLQKYVLHCKLKRDKLQRDDSDDKESVYNIRSHTALQVLKDVKEIDKALRLVQGDLQCSEVVRKRVAKYNWRKMFPENTIDGSFLNEDGKLVTLHRDGTISIDPIDESLDEMLLRYIESSSDGCDSGSRKATRTEDTSLQSSRCISTASSRAKSTPVLPAVDRTSSSCSLGQASSISRISDSKEGPFLSSESDVSISFSSSSASSTFSEVHQENSLIKVVQEAIEEHESKYLENNEDMISKSAKEHSGQFRGSEIMRQIALAQLKKVPSDLSVNNLKLFDYLLQLDLREEAKKTSKISINSLNRPNAPSQALPGSKSILPGISLNEDIPEDQPKLPVIPEELELCRQQIGRSYEKQCLKRNVEILPPMYEFKNKGEGYFRFDNSLSLLGVACDSVSGCPFQQYLCRLRSSKDLINLCFWKEAELYLCNSGEDREIQIRRSKLLIVRYLLNNKANIVPSKMKPLLVDLLSQNKGADLLREAQDHVCQKLFKNFENFNRHDKQKFIDCCVLKKDGKKLQNTASINICHESASKVQPDQVSESQTGKLNAEALKDKIANENMLVRSDRNLLPKDSERRMLLAVQLALDAAMQSDDALPVDPLNVEELEWDAENEHGSLCVKKFVRIKRRDLVEYKKRLRELVKRKKERLELERLRLAERTKPNVQTDDTPFFMKPFKRVGIWYQRPNRPRTFQDVMKDPVNREFFRRYLIYNGGEIPLNFYNNVEDLKNSRDPRSKQNKMTQITRKYFSTVPSAMEMLNTNADIVQAIPTQEKVTMAMFISAQSWVARALHDNWFDKYQHTFPENEIDSIGNMRLQNHEIARQWGKHKTKLLWHSFVHSVIKFRADILDPKSAFHFEKFLKGEIKREVEKIGQGYIPGMPLRKVIRNKLVDVTKLVSDMHFIAESDRFRTMCDDARNNADSGAYCIEEEKMLENKAKMIVDCFIDSDIPPRVQINLTQEQTELIMHNFRSGLLDRSLFYQATLNIFPCIIYLWRKFTRYKFISMYESWQRAQREKTIERTLTEVKTISEPPDYVNTSIRNVTVKRIIPARGVHGEDNEQCRLTFSMSQGMKMLIPMYAPTNLPLDSQGGSKAEGDMVCSSSMLNINRPSFLKNRRDALASSKASVKMSSHMHSNVTGKRRSSIQSQVGGRRSSLARPPSEMSGRQLNPSSHLAVPPPLIIDQNSDYEFGDGM